MNPLFGEQLRSSIRDIPGFPKPGVVFKDITPLIGNGKLFEKTITHLSQAFEETKPDLVLGIESRGFILGAPIAYKLGTGFVIVRKSGKLPYQTHRASYSLEYGDDVLEIHRDAIQAGQKVLIVDDLLATGGTAAAAVELVHKLGGAVISLVCLVELSFLKGRERLKPIPVISLIPYDHE
jgi:adenine phosphoribosyltransferase